MGLNLNLYVYFDKSTDVEPVPFNRGFYSIDLQYYFKVTLQVYTGIGNPTEVEGLATFEKKVILFGSEGNAKIFESRYKEKAFDEQLWRKTNLPHAVVEVVEPIALGARVMDVRDKNNCCCDNDFDIASVPSSICKVFGDSIIPGNETKNVYISLGVFSIIKLERRVQLLIPSYDFCVPSKECVSATDDNPCELFERIDFPVDEFFPPERCEFLENNEDDPSVNDSNTGCGC